MAHLSGGDGGKKIYLEGSGSGQQPEKRGRRGQPPRCQVEGCTADLNAAKAYYSRHRVCDMHSKYPNVIVGGIEQRFCQQCSRFHQLSEFDQGKRSCRRRLAGHNERRRKPPRHGTPSAFADNHGKAGGFMMDFNTRYSTTSGQGLVNQVTSLQRYQLSCPHNLLKSSEGCYSRASYSYSNAGTGVLSLLPPDESRNQQADVRSFLKNAAMVQPSVDGINGQLPYVPWGFKYNQLQGENSMNEDMGLPAAISNQTSNAPFTQGLDTSRGYHHTHWSL